MLDAPDADRGEVGAALVVAQPGHIVDPANILAVLKTTVANFTVPRRVEAVAALSRNALGKIQNNLLRAQFGHLPATGAT